MSAYLLRKTWIYLIHYAIITFSFREVLADHRKVCLPPETPIYGSYSPSNTLYVPGNVLQYSCDPDMEMIGDVKRMCTEDGEWTGDTPYCGKPAVLKSVPVYSSSRGTEEAYEVSDGDPVTCSGFAGSFTSNITKEWTFTFEKIVSVVGVMAIRRGGVIEVRVIDSHGFPRSCMSTNHPLLRGSRKWRMFHCPPKARGAQLKIMEAKKLSGNLLLCEVKIFLEHENQNEIVCPLLPSTTKNGIWLTNEVFQTRKVGSKAKLECNLGYTLTGDAPIVTCQPGGIWTYPNATCKKVGEIGDMKKTVVDDAEGELVRLIALGVSTLVIAVWLVVNAICIWKKCKMTKDYEEPGMKFKDNPAFVTSMDDNMYS